MEVEIIRLMEWQRIRDKAAKSQGVEAKPITPAWFRKALLCRHSMIRFVRLEVTLRDIPYWLAAHFRTHEIGFSHDTMIRSQRPDVTLPVEYDRNSARQDMPVLMTFDINLEALLNMMEKRMCVMAGPEAVKVCQAIVRELAKQDDPYMLLLAWACHPQCVWAGHICPEVFRGCGRYPHLKWFSRQEATTEDVETLRCLGLLDE